MTKVLIIGCVWPEPNSSAAGLRDWNLIEAFQEQGWRVTYSSPGKESEYSKKLQESGVDIFSIGANDPAFDEMITKLQPDFVVFDRFLMEEQFGWRVEACCPDAVRVLDTIDLHFLRRARERALKQGKSLDDVFGCRIDLQSEDSLREIASIYRSDLTLILSDFEMGLLKDRFNISPELCEVFRFCYDAPKPVSSFESRKNFAMIGNFRHAPNSDAVLWLKNEIWPLIRSKLPDAQVDVYGAYPPKEMMNLTDPKKGFFVKGSALDQFETLSQYRVGLAALRFGAGIKGKISDAWWVGTPIVTTPIGSEGMSDGGDWGGLEARSAQDFSSRCVELYSDQNLWEQKQLNGYRLLRSLFERRSNSGRLIGRLTEVRSQLMDHRKNNFTGAMLRHHFHKSTTYFSKWIEAKNA